GEHPAHGYELSKTFGADGDLEHVCKVGLSQLYAYLIKLESLGLVATTPEGPATPASRTGGGRPTKKRFSVTEAGQRQFEQWLARPVASSAYLRVDFMAKLFFARRRSAAELRTLLGSQIAVLQQELRELGSSSREGYSADVNRAYAAFARSG